MWRIILVVIKPLIAMLASLIAYRYVNFQQGLRETKSSTYHTEPNWIDVIKCSGHCLRGSVKFRRTNVQFIISVSDEWIYAFLQCTIESNWIWSPGKWRSWNWRLELWDMSMKWKATSGNEDSVMDWKIECWKWELLLGATGSSHTRIYYFLPRMLDTSCCFTIETHSSAIDFLHKINTVSRSHFWQ